MKINAMAFSGKFCRRYVTVCRFFLFQPVIMYGFYTCLLRVSFVSITGRQIRTWYDFGTKKVRLWLGGYKSTEEDIKCNDLWK